MPRVKFNWDWQSGAKEEVKNGICTKFAERQANRQTDAKQKWSQKLTRWTKLIRKAHLLISFHLRWA